jgi:hypothetical protein
MPRPYSSGVVPSSVDEVWEIVRFFNGLPSWLPGIKSSELSGGTEGQVGVVRRLTLDDGGTILERLVALNDRDHTLTYTFVGDSPTGARNYFSTVRLAPITDTGHTFVEWWAEFDSGSSEEPRLIEFFSREVFGAGISALQECFAGA